jgi:2-polyprenyl-6-methoxyphenol hydroxylase-like FAD-dependent oxidoreductase
MKRALIIGGGIAGTVTAIALKKAGHELVLYEAYERTAEGIGAFRCGGSQTPGARPNRLAV